MSEAFGIETKKEIMPYDYYTEENILHKFGKIEDAIKTIENSIYPFEDRKLKINDNKKE